MKRKIKEEKVPWKCVKKDGGKDLIREMNDLNNHSSRKFV